MLRLVLSLSKDKLRTRSAHMPLFKTLFNREALLVRLLEIVGFANTFFFFRSAEGAWSLLHTLYLFLFASYLFIRLCDAIPWYPKKETPAGIHPKRVGIRVHFQKALVPTSYILATTSSLCLFQIGWLSLAVVILADLCMLVVAPVNGILIWFHLHDKETMPVNYLSLKRGV